jgi:hypothetical protein
MEEFVTNYCRLLLTFLGFIAPVTSILLSLFQEGVDNLKDEYEQKASRLDKGVPQLKRGEKGDIAILKAVVKTVRKQKRMLWFNKRKVQIKIWLLNPNCCFFRGEFIFSRKRWSFSRS